MRIYGTIYIAMHGPAKLLRQAAELPEMERFEDAETVQTVRENLTKAGKSAAGEGIAVAYWKDFKDSNQTLETYMNLLEYIANNVPGLDIAVAAQSSNTVTGGHSYYSYYSPAGSNTLNLDDFNTYRRAEFADSGVQLWVKDHTKKTLTCNLYDKYEWIYPFIDEDADFDPEDSEYMYEIACEQMEGKPFLLHAFEEDGKMRLEVWIPKELIPNKSGKVVIEKFDYETFEDVRIEKKVDPSIGISWKEIEPYFLIPIGIGKKKTACPPEALEKIIKYWRSLDPDEDIQLKFCDGRPYICDKRGDEYFLGSMVTLEETSDRWKVDWKFPKEAQKWIPIPTML